MKDWTITHLHVDDSLAKGDRVRNRTAPDLHGTVRMVNLERTRALILWQGCKIAKWVSAWDFERLADSKIDGLSIVLGMADE